MTGSKVHKKDLAIYGGEKAVPICLPKWPSFSNGAFEAVKSVLKSGKTNYRGGSRGVLFEEEFAKWAETKNAILVSSGTAALHLALEALGIGEGDEVICTPYSFRASWTAISNAGAKAVFADVGDDHMINAQTIEKAITKRTKAVVVVHLYGQVADMAPILALARKCSLKVIEDCAQCLGGSYCARKVGTLGDAGCFSFCQTKHITSGGEGGMVVCRSKKVADNVRSLREHGWAVGSEPRSYAEKAGYNFRLSEMQSAVGLSEFCRLESWNLPRRRKLALRFIEHFRNHPLVKSLPFDDEKRRASFWLVPIVVDAAKLKVPLRQFAEALQAEGAPVYRVLWPLGKKLPNAEKLISSTIAFWVHPTYNCRIVDATIKAFDKVAKVYMK